MIFFYCFYTQFAWSSRSSAVLGRARLMVGGGFSSLVNWFSGQGSTIMISQRVLEKLQFEWKHSVKSVASGYGAFLSLDHLCSQSRHGSPDQVIFILKPVLKSWEPKFSLTNYLQLSLIQGQTDGQIKKMLKKPCFYLMNFTVLWPICALDTGKFLDFFWAKQLLPCDFLNKLSLTDNVTKVKKFKLCSSVYRHYFL